MTSSLTDTLPRDLLLQQILTSPNIECYDVPKIAQSLNLRLDDDDYYLLGNHFFNDFEKKVDDELINYAYDEENVIGKIFKKLCIVEKLAKKGSKECHKIVDLADKMGIELSDEDFRFLGIELFTPELFLMPELKSDEDEFEIPSYSSYAERFYSLCHDTDVNFRPNLIKFGYGGQPDIEQPESFVIDHIDEIMEQIEEFLTREWKEEPNLFKRIYYDARTRRIHVIMEGDVAEMAQRYGKSGEIPYFQNLGLNHRILADVSYLNPVIDGDRYILTLDDLRYTHVAKE